MARYLAVVRAKPEYYRMKAHTEKLLKHIPIIGNELSDAAFDIKSALKRIIYSDSWFEDLGLHYIGPIDGHNIQQLCEAFEMAKKYDKPVLLHVNTLKGKGYDFAERSPEQFHGISKFDINTGEPLSSGTSFSSNFGDIMCRFASCDDRVCAITAAMSIGTGLERFSNEYKYRFFDIGIAEEHAVAFALGLAKSGFIPVLQSIPPSSSAALISFCTMPRSRSRRWSLPSTAPDLSAKMARHTRAFLMFRCSEACRI